VQRFISGLRQTYKEMIEFDEPNNLEDTIWKEMYFYEKFRSKKKPRKDWKKKSSLGFKKMGFKSSRFKSYGKDSRMSLPTRSVYQ
jgi:hypothetical protein